MYRIPDENLATLDKRIEKLNRRARKLGMQPVVYKVTGQDTERYTDEDGNVRVRVYDLISVSGTEPKINGWTFVATLEHAGEAGVIIRSVPGTGDLPERFRTASPDHCDHCGYFRYRKDTFVLRNEQGEYKQVGRQCIRDFIGWGSPESVAAQAELLTLFGDALLAAEYGGGDGKPHNERYLDTDYILQLAACAIRQFGWKSRAKAEEEYTVSTRDRIFDTLFPPIRGSSWQPLRPNGEDKATAEAAVEWAREVLANKEKLNDYEQNLMVVVKSDLLENRSVGLAASLIPAHKRWVQQQAEKPVGKNEWVGKVGERREWTATVKSVFEKAGDWGVTYITHMMDDGENHLVWFGSKKLEMDHTYTFKATIKDHTEFNGTKQTVVSRLMGEKETLPLAFLKAFA